MELDHQDAILGSKEQNLIAKGKRTKRQRLHSPIPFVVSTNSSSGDGGFFVVDDHRCDFVAENDHRYVKLDDNKNQNHKKINNATEEEEDMANCLILLAQGRPYCANLPREHVDTGRFHHNRRVAVENVAVGGEKGGGGGCYGYECKTCYRTFPSFQALGGHRASHKKPKAMEVEKKMFLSSDDEEIIQFKNNNNVSHSLSLQFNQRGSLYSNNNNHNGKAKVHECAVCGAEFTSGQALGGHMRRHRALPVGTTTTTTNTALSLTPTVVEPDDHRPPKRQRSVLSLDLDLNLPAPQEHDQRESKSLIKSNQQQQQQQQQQQPIVFPSRTLVDCHY